MWRGTVIACGAALVFSGCGSFWDGAARRALPASSARVSSMSTSFLEYRYKIPGLGPSSLARIDRFGRGLDDIVVTEPASSDIVIFKNRGDGSFKLDQVLESCPGGDEIDVEDLTGDGYEDILVSCPAASLLSLFVGNGKGGFARRDIPIGPGAVSAQIAPYAAEVRAPFLAVLYELGSSLELLKNRGAGDFERTGTRLPVPADPSALISDVFSPDGSIGYAVTSRANSTFTVYLRQGQSFARADYPAPEAPQEIDSLGLRGPGVMDLAIPSGRQNLFRIYLNDGSGHFPDYLEYSIPEGPANGISTTHLRGLEHDEVALQSSVTGDVIFYPNFGGMRLGKPEIIHAGERLSGMVAGAFFHRSVGMDLALVDTSSSELVVLLNERPEYH